MINKNQTPESVDEYIAAFPEKIQNILQKLRTTIKKAAPGAKETFSYQMPAYKLNGVLVYFAAFKNHIGLFPTASGVEAFKEELGAYKCSKGTIRFPITDHLPWDLITTIVKFRVMQNLEKEPKKT